MTPSVPSLKSKIPFLVLLNFLNERITSSVVGVKILAKFSSALSRGTAEGNKMSSRRVLLVFLSRLVTARERCVNYQQVSSSGFRALTTRELKRCRINSSFFHAFCQLRVEEFVSVIVRLSAVLCRSLFYFLVIFVVHYLWYFLFKLHCT